MDRNVWKMLSTFRSTIQLHHYIDLLNRVLLIREHFRDKDYTENSLYKYMEDVTIKDFSKCGYSAKIFFDFYNATKNLNDREIIDIVYTVKGYTGHTPLEIVELLDNKLNKKEYKHILITECEKWPSSLIDIIKNRENAKFTFTVDTYNVIYASILRQVYKKYKNVEYVVSSIYDGDFLRDKYDCIITIPDFLRRSPNSINNSISKDSTVFALKTLLTYLNKNSDLYTVTGARITFGETEVKRFRNFIRDNYSVYELYKMPGGLFSPFSNVDTFFITFTNRMIDEVNLKRFDFEGKSFKSIRDNTAKLVIKDSVSMKENEFKILETWYIDSIFINNSEIIKSYNESIVKKITLEKIATIFRGKNILRRNEVKIGRIGVINIVDITEYGINYNNIHFIDDEVRKIASYKLEDRDILITSRGTQIKIAIFKQQDFVCIPTSNINVIRLETNLINSEYLKLFLESPTGKILIESLQRGNVLININCNDLKKMQIPLLSIDRQQEIVNEYNSKYNIYKKALQDWEKAQEEIDVNIYKQ